MVTLQRTAEMPSMMVFDRHNHCAFANTGMASLLGYKVTAMKGMDIAKFMAQPFGYLHHRWIKVRGRGARVCVCV